MKTSTGKPTKAELQRWEYFPVIGCLACRLLGFHSVPEVHHLLSGNRRIGHMATIPLCPAHHRGAGFVEHVHVACFAHGSKPFRATFGSDEDLLRETDRRIEAIRSQRA